MSQFKVPHNKNGDHNPAEGDPVLTDPYELRGVTLKYVGHELTRTTTFILWEDTITKKYYRSSVYLLQALLNGELEDEAEVSFVKKGGLFLTADFGFEQRGKDVLLTVITLDNDVIVRAAAEIFSAFLDGTLKGREFKQQVKLFMKELNYKTNITGHGTGEK